MMVAVTVQDWSVSETEPKLWNVTLSRGHIKDNRDTEPWQNKRGDYNYFSTSLVKQKVSR